MESRSQLHKVLVGKRVVGDVSLARGLKSIRVSGLIAGEGDRGVKLHSPLTEFSWWVQGLDSPTKQSIAITH